MTDKNRVLLNGPRERIRGLFTEIFDQEEWHLPPLEEQAALSLAEWEALVVTGYWTDAADRDWHLRFEPMFLILYLPTTTVPTSP